MTVRVIKSLLNTIHADFVAFDEVYHAKSQIVITKFEVDWPLEIKVFNV